MPHGPGCVLKPKWMRGESVTRGKCSKDTIIRGGFSVDFLSSLCVNKSFSVRIA